MEFMLDTVNLEAIKKWEAILPLAGVTSNPSIVKKEGNIDFFAQMSEIRAIIGDKPSVHAQVVCTDVDGIIRDAHALRENIAGNFYVKVPVTPAGLTAIKQLKKEGFKITATAIYTVIQGLTAIEMGADYLAPYYNRMENLGTDPVDAISQLAQAIKVKGSSTKILAASFKNVSQLVRAISAGAHSVTAGADIYAMAFANPSIQKAVADFSTDWSVSQGRSEI